MDKGNIPLERQAQHFEAFSRSEGKPLRTVEWHYKDIAYLVKYLKQEGRSTLLADVNILVVRDFILLLSAEQDQMDRPPQYAFTNRQVSGQ